MKEKQEKLWRQSHGVTKH